MSEQYTRRINRLMANLDDTSLASSRWLRTHGYSSSLVSRYVASGWLESPARGVYMRKGGRLLWEGVVRTLQLREELSLHVGGRFALAWQGYEHYLRLGEGDVVTLYGPDRLPGWTTKLPLSERFEACGKGPFDLPALRLTTEVPDRQLADRGFVRREAGSAEGPIVCSTPERAMLELCNDPPDAALIYEADALMQGMTTLRPRRIGMLLCHCTSIKAKRLFLALAERHGHAWLPRIPMDDVDLGRGKRSLVPGGRLHPTYLITLPGDLDEHLG
ncbi:type IV toxin-antitoxin system AbiEi family antitoxin domain-containing protein [Halomonas maura]|uniref:type IV toxin-antitoxin system AbiEi family antitoxin domain-containing protein n=1 Tax=Halomonas maura TaxID=117606 RepID=UPI0025B2C78C|nr:type IV toxin-antitoxin system AbiEi family antitoxin domain-containing protein [Halomonas maura]MDN3554884.1 type IV toxin-antitoxin system AbiEi family antitoxin domain-containing protein [Halomonas maura]